MKTFKIIEGFNDYKYIILNTSYLNPLEDKGEIEQVLKAKNHRGKVLIDLLLKNGTASNRFVEIEFDGEELQLQTLKIVKPSAKTKKFTTNFYRLHKKLLKNSILNRVQRFLLLKGELA